MWILGDSSNSGSVVKRIDTILQAPWQGVCCAQPTVDGLSQHVNALIWTPLCLGGWAYSDFIAWIWGYKHGIGPFETLYRTLGSLVIIIDTAILVVAMAKTCMSKAEPSHTLSQRVDHNPLTVPMAGACEWLNTFGHTLHREEAQVINIECLLCHKPIGPQTWTYTCPYEVCGISVHRHCIDTSEALLMGNKTCPICQNPTKVTRPVVRDMNMPEEMLQDVRYHMSVGVAQKLLDESPDLVKDGVDAEKLATIVMRLDRLVNGNIK